MGGGVSKTGARAADTTFNVESPARRGTQVETEGAAADPAPAHQREPGPDDAAVRCLDRETGVLHLGILDDPIPFLRKNREQFDNFVAQLVATYRDGVRAVCLPSGTPMDVRLRWEAMLDGTGIALHAALPHVGAERAIHQLPNAVENIALGYLPLDELQDLGRSAPPGSAWHDAAARAQDAQSRQDAEIDAAPMNWLAGVPAHQLGSVEVIRLMWSMGWRLHGGDDYSPHEQTNMQSNMLLAAALKRDDLSHALPYAVLTATHPDEFGAAGNLRLPPEMQALIEQEGFEFLIRVGLGAVIGLNSGRLVPVQVNRDDQLEPAMIDWPAGFEPIRQFFPTAEYLYVRGNLGGLARIRCDSDKFNVEVLPLPPGRTVTGFLGGDDDQAVALQDNGHARTARGPVPIPDGARAVQACIPLTGPHHILLDDGRIIEEGNPELGGAPPSWQIKEMRPPGNIPIAGHPICLVSTQGVPFSCIFFDEASRSITIYAEDHQGKSMSMRADGTLCVLTNKDAYGNTSVLFPQLNGSCISLDWDGFTAHAPGELPGLEVRNSVPAELALRRPWVRSERQTHVRWLEAAHRDQGLRSIGQAADFVQFAATAAVPALQAFTVPPRRAAEWLYSVPVEQLEGLVSQAMIREAED